MRIEKVMGPTPIFIINVGSAAFFACEQKYLEPVLLHQFFMT
jgi:hypothetical protein